MFEKYNEKARRSIFFARYEASEFGSPEIESEHLLLGLLREGRSGLNIILGLNNAEDEIHIAIVAATTQRPKFSTSVDLPLTSESKRILAYGAEEAARLNQKHIGIEHLMLGILREEKCLAARLLRERGLKLEKARALVAEAEKDLTASGTIGSGMGVGTAGPSARFMLETQIVDAANAETLCIYRNPSQVPRIGERVFLRSAETGEVYYRVQDVVWELDDVLNTKVLKQVKVYVVKEGVVAPATA
jgi:ATP-dependent Clp protease ATP-binding subunit ClpA